MTPYAPRAVRVVADTNIVVSGLLWEGGPPRRLIDAAFAGEIELYTSAVLLDELADVLTRAKFARKLSASALSAEQLVWRYARLAKRIRPDTVERVVPGDPDDDHVLACAFAANVELIISGDHHLRALGSYRGIRIVNSATAISLIEQHP